MIKILFRFTKLIKPTDGPAYDKNLFTEARSARFGFFVLTSNPFPSSDLMENMYVIRVHIPA